jgi:hypothetical protein
MHPAATDEDIDRLSAQAASVRRRMDALARDVEQVRLVIEELAQTLDVDASLIGAGYPTTMEPTAQESARAAARSEMPATCRSAGQPGKTEEETP